VADDDRISQIHTLWSVVRRAHTDKSGEARSAQQQMLDRYGAGIQRYLLGALRDQTAADDAYQEFALRFLKGDYGSADPEKGRFRYFLKTILYRLVVEHHRGNKRRRSPQMDSEFPEPEVIDAVESDQQFQQSWCDGLLKRAWDGLAAIEKETGRPVYTMMRAKIENPNLKSTELANQLTERLGKPISSANVRVMLHRSREEFAQLLLQEVAYTLDDSTRDSIEEELVELGLLEYCRPALERIE
jgi:RNA polymerase sigma-70 factor (ECF subfamily)